MALGVTALSASAVTGSNTTATSAAIDTTGAVTLVMFIKWGATTPTGISWTDSKSNTGANAVQIQTIKAFSGVQFAMYYWPVTSVGASHTVTASWTNSAACEILFGGITEAGPVTIDQSADWLFDGGVPYDCNSVTTTVANSIVVGYWQSSLTAADSTLAYGNSFTGWGHDENGTVGQMVILYRIVSATGAQTPRISATDFAGNGYGMVANFALGSASGPPPYNRWHQMGPIIAT